MLSCDRRQWPKLLYCPLGIEPTEFIPGRNRRSHPAPIRLLSVGRLSQEKGQAILIESVAALSSRGKDVQLHLVGDGPDRRWLEQYSEELGVSSHVVFKGWLQQAQLMEPYLDTDIFVLSSLAEGIPIVLLEAMSLKKVCVAPCIAGIPEVIEHGANGMLFSVGDVNELTERICSLVESIELRERMGERARETVVRDYDMARSTARFAVMLEKQLTLNQANSD